MLAERVRRRAPTCGARPSYKQLRDDALDCERWNRLHPTEPPRTPYVTEQLGDADGPDRRGDRLREGGARRDRPVRARSRTSCSAPTATASPTSGPRCAATSRSTPPTSWSRVLDGLAQTGRRQGRGRWPRRSARYEIDPEAPRPPDRPDGSSARQAPRSVELVVGVPVLVLVVVVVVVDVVIDDRRRSSSSTSARRAGAFPEQAVVEALLELARFAEPARSSFSGHVVTCLRSRDRHYAASSAPGGRAGTRRCRTGPKWLVPVPVEVDEVADGGDRAGARGTPAGPARAGRPRPA